MPAKRSPKKSRKPSPSLVDMTPTDLDARTVAPVAVPPVVATPTGATPPTAGPRTTGGARLTGRGQRVGQNRFYAFRRS
ncbi:hypothetical protein K7640_25470 [Micromonospora sp. PLK6-60]|nr:hypothetical protein [Micromonospora sp. PLK6-60]